MKIGLFAVLGVVLLASSAYAHMGIQSVETVMGGMMANQNVSQTSLIDCNKVTDKEFEELGDAVMEKVVGNHDLHEQMDNMMGGEGSVSLTQMHIIMGKNWLGCGTGTSMMGGMMGNTLGYGMMPAMMRMMGNYYPAYYSSYNTLLAYTVIGWVLAAVLLFLLIFTLTGKIWIKKKRK